MNMDHLASLTTDFPGLKHILKLSVNHAILYLPLGVIDVLHALDNAIKNETLTPLTLHAKVFECLALISSELENSETTAFYDPDRIAALDITSLHATGLTSEDIQGIQRAKSIINDNLQTPPTINQLSKMLYMNEQKLTSGFRQMFKMTIGSYIKDMRLSHAANLLSTTDLSIELSPCVLVTATLLILGRPLRQNTSERPYNIGSSGPDKNEICHKTFKK